ncbi:VCBS domain-containing protein [Rhizobium sp. Leaf384]|uniref:VCBS domain-containing protein n=1 Tax=Rhizobium sp. Leaf384 TaxID=1736358 RepID=UPI0009EB712A|nr:VCBS domain-containing protein [Rhizobium sp. Leaf384]
MTISADIYQIAERTGLKATTDHEVGAQTPVATLRSFTELSFAKDGVYYNKSLNMLVISKDGTALDGFNFSGVSINVQANNVVIKNSYFDASVGMYAINAFAGTKNLTVENSTFDGLKLDRSSYNVFISSKGENTVIKDSEFLNAPNDGITLQSGQISGNVISGGGYATGAHSDAIWIGATNGAVVISDNVIDWRSSADAPVATNNAVRVTSEMGNIDNVLIKGNIILGGSASVLVTDGATLTHTASQVGTVTNVVVTNNVVDQAQYFDLYPTGRPADLVYRDNLHASGTPVSAGIASVGIVPDRSTLNVVQATSSAAVVKGGAGHDFVIGGDGNNSLFGGDGNDVIFGGAGRDYLTGGNGTNIFYYTSLRNSGLDYIQDFKQGVDKIALADLDGAPTSADGWQWLGGETFTGHAWQLRVIRTATVTTVQVDSDGDLTADFQTTLKGNVAVGLGDFILASKATSSVVDVPITKPVGTSALIVVPNNLPTITGEATGTIIAGSSTAATGQLLFSDADASNVLTVSIKSYATQYLDVAGAAHAAWLDSTDIAALKAGFSLSLGGASGSAQWTYDTTKTDLSFVGAGETAQITTTVEVNDGAGGVKLQDVVVTVTGVNDAPVILGSTTLSVKETEGLSYSASTMSREGLISFADVDLGDVHSVSVAAVTGARGYRGNLSATIAEDSTGTGTGAIKWTFTAQEKTLDYLAAGETLVQNYWVDLKDNNGINTRANVAVTIVGTNDNAIISGTSVANLWESKASTLSAKNTLTFFDADVTDKLTSSVSKQTLNLVTAAGVDMTYDLTATEISQLKSAFHMATGELNSNKGSGVWSYFIDDSSLDFLGQNDTLTVVNTVKLDDGHGGATTQDVVIKLRGVNDAPVFQTHKAGDSATTANVKEAAQTSGSSNVLESHGKLAFSDIDISDSHTVRVTAKSSGYVGKLTASVDNDTTGGHQGDVVWLFQVDDGALDKLGAGQTAKQTYTISLSDGKSGTTTQEVTVNLSGSSDTFLFQNTATKTLTTFASGDLIGLNSNAFGGGLHQGDLLDSYFSTGKAPTEAGHGQLYQDASHKTLYWDQDGSGSASAIVVAKFASAVHLQASDFFVI